jgi:hypothetical protein
MKNIKLTYYDKKKTLSENIGFLRGLFRTSLWGFLLSVAYIAVLIGLDFGIRQLTFYFDYSSYNILNCIACVLYKTNDVIGIKFLDYFKDVIVIVAGVLGVILGLFFTTFMNIITTRYANINSVIIYQLLEQKQINRYLKFLATLVASAIIFQFMFAVGYDPTCISVFIFTLSVIVAILAFISIGRHIIIFFKADFLVADLLTQCNAIFHRYFRNKKYFKKEQNGKNIISKILNNISKAKTIVDESIKLEMNNTDFSSISKKFLDFAIYYNSFKQTFPSNKDWFPKIQQFQSWENANFHDYDLYKSTGVSLLQKNIDNFIAVEKYLINIQFYIFQNLENTNDKVQIPLEQHKYLQVIAYQCEAELFELFFDKLEEYIKNNLQKTDNKENRNNLYFISLYSSLLVQYLVGFNHNVSNCISANNIKTLAKAVHNLKDVDRIMAIPYQIRIWIDNYQEKLQNEKIYNNKKITTPLFYTEYELAYQFQQILKTSYDKITDSIQKRISIFAKYLKHNKFELESLFFLTENIETFNKIEYFLATLENKIITELNTANQTQEDKFNFLGREEIIKRNNACKQNTIDEIWNLGLSAHNLKDKDLPDIFGNCYQLICEDILNKAFDENGIALTKYLRLFYTYNLLYLDSLMKKIDQKQLELTTSKLFPIIIDLFEVSAIAIIISKLHNNKDIETALFKFWDDYEKEDATRSSNFWKITCANFEYFKQSLYIFSSSSKEINRQQRLVQYLKQSNNIRLENVQDGFYHSNHYVTDIEDIYLKEIVRTIGTDNFSSLNFVDLSEVFIEYFLRQRESLKNLNIKETRYGANIRRNMDTDSE